MSQFKRYLNLINEMKVNPNFKPSQVKKIFSRKEIKSIKENFEMLINAEKAINEGNDVVKNANIINSSHEILRKLIKAGIEKKLKEKNLESGSGKDLSDIKKTINLVDKDLSYYEKLEEKLNNSKNIPDKINELCKDLIDAEKNNSYNSINRLHASLHKILSSDLIFLIDILKTLESVDQDLEYYEKLEKMLKFKK